MIFDHPWLLLLLIPAALAWWRWGRGRWQWLRLMGVLLLVLAAAGPRQLHGGGGSDVVLVVDGSGSMGDARRGAAEWLRLAGGQRHDGDRLAVVAVGDGVQIAQGPEALALLRAEDLSPGEDGTDLAAGLEAALGLFAPGRTGRVVLISDGEATGRSPEAAATRLAAAGLQVDCLPIARPSLPDAAVVDVELPSGARLGESLLATLRFTGDARETRTWRVLRDGVLVAEGSVTLRPGATVDASFADRPIAAGITTYTVVLQADHDREPRNNQARAVLRVAGAERVLVMSAGTNVATALRAAGLAVDLRPPGRLTLADVLASDTVVLDDVPADLIGAEGIRALAQRVEHLGGGLVMLGGRRSGGAGGWHRSSVENVLPVSFELRDEHRRATVAIAIAIDRSGSMAAPAGGGRQKIDLANEGACAAIELLGPRDQVALYAVDSAPHEIIPLQYVEHPQALSTHARGINSAGGGIYIYEALVACGAALSGAKAGAAHIVLFADAADSEEPGDYKTLISQFRAAGITVSAIGMGSESDCDAHLLKDIATLGGGRIAFASDPQDIPRLFAQETILVARSSWIDQRVTLAPRRGDCARVLGAAFSATKADDAWPAVPGYNLAWARPRADVLALAPGDPQAPAVAAWRCGTGRSVWVGLDCDAEQSADLRAWPGYAPLLAGLTRWCAGAGEHLPGLVTARRHGRTVDVRLELDPAMRTKWPTVPPIAAIAGGSMNTGNVRLDPSDDGVWSGRFTLADAAVAVPAVAIGDSALVGPALCLPYSPEAAPRLEQPSGASVLAAIASHGNGRVRSDLADLFANPPSPGGSRSLIGWCVGIAALLLAFDLTARRLALSRDDLPRLPLKYLRPQLARLRRIRRTTPVAAPTEIQTPPLPSAPTVPPTTDNYTLTAMQQAKRRK
jgi:uncharacterized membrane protein